MTRGGGNLAPCPPQAGQVQRGAGAPPRRAPRRPRGPRLLQPRPEQKHNEGWEGGWDSYFNLREKKKKAPAMGVAVTARIKLENWLIK